MKSARFWMAFFGYIVITCFIWVAAHHLFNAAKRQGRNQGYNECIEAINSITYRTPNETYNTGAEAMKSSAIAQIGCYREERK